MKKKRYLLSEIQKEAYEKGFKAKAELNDLLEKYCFENAIGEKDRKVDTKLEGFIMWSTYENKILNNNIRENLIVDEGYKPFKDLMYAYILSEKKQVIESAKRNYKCKVSWIETGKFLAETNKETIEIDTPATSAAFIIGTAISGGSPEVGTALAKFVKKKLREYEK